MISNDSKLLNSLVKLRREMGRPAVDANYGFSAEVRFNQEVEDILQEVYELLGDSGSKGHVECEITHAPAINNIFCKDSLLSEKQKYTGKNVRINVTTRQNSQIRFYRDIDDLINKIGFSIPDSFYLVDSDYCYGFDDGNVKPAHLLVLENIIEFADSLSLLANKVDTRQGHRVCTYYVSDKENKDQVIPIDLEIIFFRELSEVDNFQFALLKDFNLKDQRADYDKKMLIKSAICEVLKGVKLEKPCQHFKLLIVKWHDVEAGYYKNLETFITGISFSKLNQEVQERHIKFIDDINGAIFDVTGKLTIVTGAFAAALVLLRSDSVSFIQFFGFLLATVLMTIPINFNMIGLFGKLEHVSRQIEVQYSTFKNRFLDSPKERLMNSKLDKEIEDSIDDLNNRIVKARLYLKVNWVVLFLPLTAIVIYGIWSYTPWASIKTAFDSAIHFVCSLHH